MGWMAGIDCGQWLSVGRGKARMGSCIWELGNLRLEIGMGGYGSIGRGSAVLIGDDGGVSLQMGYWGTSSTV